MTLEQFLESHARHMCDCFNLNHFDVYISFETGLQSSMEIDVDYRYLDAEISYGPKIQNMWTCKEHEMILKCLAHELTHIITGELSNPYKLKRTVRGKVATHFDERVTEHVSRLAYRLYCRWMTEHKIELLE